MYINLVDTVRLDSTGFAPFGEVVSGMDVVDALYSGYGEDSGGGLRRGDQRRIVTEGNTYLDREYPSSTASSAPAGAEAEQQRLNDTESSWRASIRYCAVLLAVAPALSVVGCEGLLTGLGLNRAPEALGQIPAVSVEWDPIDVAVSPYFSDPDGDPLIFFGHPVGLGSIVRTSGNFVEVAGVVHGTKGTFASPRRIPAVVGESRVSGSTCFSCPAACFRSRARPNASFPGNCVPARLSR